MGEIIQKSRESLGERRGKGTGYTSDVTAELLARREALRACRCGQRPGSRLLLDLLRHVNSINERAGGNCIPTCARL